MLGNKITVENANNVVSVEPDNNLISVESVQNRITVDVETNNITVQRQSNNIAVHQEVNKVSVESNSPIIKVQNPGLQGPGVAVGGTVRQILSKVDAQDFNTQWLYDWGLLATNVKYNGTETVFGGGLVLEGIFQGLGTIYRFINDTLDASGYPIEDSFYSNFDGLSLTNLLGTRG